MNQNPAVPTDCKVAILGFGTVGQSVARILTKNTPPGLKLTHIYNRRIEEKKIAWVPSTVKWTDDINSVLSSDVDVVVELIGGNDPAEHWIRKALTSGKSVVTANKQVIAESGPELIELAIRHGQIISFEASVAGGVPVVRGLEEGLSGDRLFRIVGILNGTCNFILTQMETSGKTLDEAVKEAQNKGFAETDPTADIDGLDARAKLAILSWIGLGYHLKPTSIVSRSIRTIEAIDFAYAARLDCTIRQISLVERGDGNNILASVQPALVPTLSPLAAVQGSQNLIMVTGEFGGETGFFGYGAGGDPTAVAVVSDLIGIVAQRQSPLPSVRKKSTSSIEAVGNLTTPHYLRFTVKDSPYIISSLAGILSRHNINIGSVLQEPGQDQNALPFVITLEACSSSVIEQALSDIKALDFHVRTPVNLPMFPNLAWRDTRGEC